MDSESFGLTFGLAFASGRALSSARLISDRDVPNAWSFGTILRRLLHLYDPMGWIAPITISFKIFMQRF